MIAKVYKDTNLILEHEIHEFSINNGYMSLFMTGGLVVTPFSVGDYVNVKVFEGENMVADITSTFESYQFSMSSYVSNGGDGLEGTQTGVTNNSLVFRVLQMHGGGEKPDGIGFRPRPCFLHPCFTFSCGV
jgi:hypothetical protein